jgi:hypothetical protein
MLTRGEVLRGEFNSLPYLPPTFHQFPNLKVNVNAETSEWYLSIQFLPQRKHNESPLPRSTD